MTDRPGVVILLLSLLCLPIWTWAEPDKGGITVEAAHINLVNDVYLVDADISFRLSEQLVQALNNSVPLTITLEIEVRAPRAYLWDDRIAKLRRDFRLERHPLTDGFVIDDLVTGVRQSFDSLAAALSSLGHVVQMAVVERRRLEPATQYRAFLRAHLDIEALPAPLRLRAYFSSGWQLSSSWFIWDFTT